MWSVTIPVPTNRAALRCRKFGDAKAGLWAVEEDGEEQQPFPDLSRSPSGIDAERALGKAMASKEVCVTLW